MRLFGLASRTLATLLLAVVSLVLPAQDLRPAPVSLRPDAPAYAKHGPYWVGVREFVIRTSVEGRSLHATLWYPALNPNGITEANTFAFDDTAYSKQVLTIRGHALVNAPPDRSGGP